MVSKTNGLTTTSERQFLNHDACKPLEHEFTITPHEIQIAGLRGNQIIPTEKSIYFDASDIGDPTLSVGFLVQYVFASKPSQTFSWLYTNLETWLPVRIIRSDNHPPRLILGGPKCKITKRDCILIEYLIKFKFGSIFTESI